MYYVANQLRESILCRCAKGTMKAYFCRTNARGAPLDSWQRRGLVLVSNLSFGSKALIEGRASSRPFCCGYDLSYWLESWSVNSKKLLLRIRLLTLCQSSPWATLSWHCFRIDHLFGMSACFRFWKPSISGMIHSLGRNSDLHRVSGSLKVCRQAAP